MLLHIFVNRCKCLLRNKETMFWTLMFPIVLATLFGLAFNNLSSEGEFREIDIAVVDNEEYQNNQTFQSALAAVSAKDAGEKSLFKLRLTTFEQAEDLLKNNQITGYILLDGGANLAVRESGIKETIIKEFLDDYTQKNSALSSIIKQNPEARTGLAADAMGNKNYLKEVSPTRAEPDTTLNYYYALVAMACLFGSFWGLKEVSAVQADLSPQGARVNLAPVHKLKYFAYSLCTATLIHILSIIILLAYLSLVLKVNFGSDLLYILLASMAGSAAGVSMGAMIGALIKKGENFKSAILVCVSMTCSFLAGLMVVNMKYIVTQAVPLMAYINPANLITDAFYSLYYYDSYGRFFTNIGLLLGISLVFYLIVYLVLRRQRYASI